AKTTRRCTRWILQRLAIDRTSVAAVAKALALGWDLVNDLAISKIRAIVYDQPGHLDGVRVLGVDEHVWKHVRGDGSSSFVTVLVDLTPVVDGTGPSRLLDMVAGRRPATRMRNALTVALMAVVVTTSGVSYAQEAERPDNDNDSPSSSVTSLPS